MVFAYLTKDNIFDKYDAAKSYTDKLTEPFPEYERVKRNKPSNNIAYGYPRVTDGTTASYIEKSPRRIVQQIPTGTVESDDDGWLPIIAEFVLTHKIIPLANKEYDLIQKCWMMIENGLTFGFSCIYTPFIRRAGEFTTDMILPYWGDVMFQPGKKSGYDCDYYFMRAHYQRSDIEALIASVKEIKNIEKDAEVIFDVDALREVIDYESEKDEQATTPEERERGVDTKSIEIVTGFQYGEGAMFYMFHPGTKKIVGQKKSKDPRGVPPVDWFYADIDGSNPCGRGIVALLAPIQNLIDSDMQMYQFNRALMLAPPIEKRGTINKNKIIWRPNAIIDMGTDPNNSIRPMTIDTSAIANYPDIYNLQKTQLQTLTDANGDTSVGASAGNPNFSKTPMGIKVQQEITSVNDNFLRKMFEAAYGHWCETAINLYFAERSGKDTLKLDEQTADRIRKLIDEGKAEPGILNERNEILIDFDTATPALKFRVDTSSSRTKNNADQIEAIDSTLESIANNAILAQYFQEHPEKLFELHNARIRAIGIEDPELVTVDVKQFEKEKKLAEEKQDVQQMIGQESQEPIDPVEDPQLAQFADTMRQLGYDEQTIADAIEMINKGYSDMDIATALGVEHE